MFGTGVLAMNGSMTKKSPCDKGAELEEHNEHEEMEGLNGMTPLSTLPATCAESCPGFAGTDSELGFWCM